MAIVLAACANDQKESSAAVARAASAKQEEIMKSLNSQWADLAAELPNVVSAIQNRIELLSRKSSRNLAAGVDINAVKAGLGQASSLWSKAQGAFAASNMQEAVSTAKDVKAKLNAVATTLELALPPAAAPPAAK